MTTQRSYHIGELLELLSTLGALELDDPYVMAGA